MDRSLTSFEIADIRESQRRIDEVLATNIFSRDQVGNPLIRSALIEALILLNDLLQKAERLSLRVSYSEDVQTTGKVRDVTDLIRETRNAACHVPSGNHDIRGDRLEARGSFNFIFGRGCLIQAGDTRIESEYEDEIAFYFGAYRVYFRRHILRAFDDVKERLLPLTQVV